jgi:uncharacterized protein
LSSFAFNDRHHFEFLDFMYVIALRLTLRLPNVHSLKEKRAVIRRVKTQMLERMQLSMHEVDGLDSWQRAVVGLAVVSTGKSTALQVVERSIRLMVELGSISSDFELIGQQRQWLHLDGSDDQLAPALERFEAPEAWLAESQEDAPDADPTNEAV